MRILQICKKVPWPLTDGESIAVNALSKEYACLSHQVDLLCMNTKKHYRNIEEANKELNHYSKIHEVYIDNSLTLFKIISNLFSSLPIHVDRIRNKNFEEKLISLLANEAYDIIQIETIYPASYLHFIAQKTNAKVVVRCHNVEHLIWYRLAYRSGLIKRWYLLLQSKKIKRLEIQILNKVDLYLPLSVVDGKGLKTIGVKSKSIVIPIGLELNKYQKRIKSRRESKAVKLCFIGTLDWQPNVDGILWFLTEVWPQLNLKYLEKLEIHIAGRSIPNSITQRETDKVFIYGEVSDALDFIADSDAMIVPLFAGSGQRVKILEAMALGIPVITTSLGLEGIDAKNGKHVIIANDKNSFNEAIDTLIHEPDCHSEMRENMQDFMWTHFDSLSISKRLIAAYEQLLSQQD